MLKSILLVWFCLAFTVVNAQDGIYLTAEKVIALAKTDNLDIKREILNAEIANAKASKAKEWWLPELFVGTQLHQLDGSGLNTDGRIFEDVDRQSRWYGGEARVDWNIGKGIYDAKVAKLRAKSAALQSEVGKNQVTLDVLETYYDLLVITAKKALYEDMVISKSNLVDQLKVQVDVGLRLSSELLIAKSNKSRLMLEKMNLEQDYQSAMSNMLISLNITENQKLYVDIADLKKMDVDEATVSDSKVEDHPLIAASEFQAKAAEQQSKQVWNSIFIPNVGVGYDIGTFGEFYNTTRPTDEWNGYIGWSVPVGQLIYGGDSKIANQAKAISQLELAQNKTIITNKITECRTKMTTYESMISLAEEGGQFAKEALNQSKTRQEAGLGTIYEILLAEEEYMSAQLLYLDAVVDYNMTRFMLADALGLKI
ncbi:MAG: outer membrane protein [Saprospiraceae bacterium]|jgi:outer membrane protein TolC